ncbi:MAG TPA: class I SAM-dependent methyltransferase [bacterium]|nr:class I SAM-dependent methyltransferase [bacterium]HPQ17635.1 class I SAM-dependent methyltransferase [bacterium]
MIKLKDWFVNIDLFDRNKNKIMMIAAQEKLNQLKDVNEWLYEVIKPFIKKRILEIGCGLGGFLKILNEKNYYEFIAGTEIENSYFEKLNNQKKIKIINHNILTDSLEELINYQFDTVICLNVLEHIENDKEAFNRICEIPISKGYIIILVPAFKFLFNKLDSNAGHFRRYSKKDFIYLCSQNKNIEIKKIFYFNFFGIFGWFINGKILKKNYLSNHLLDVFNFLVPVFKITQLFTQYFFRFITYYYSTKKIVLYL